MTQGDDEVGESKILFHHRKNPSQVAEIEAKKKRPRSRRKKEAQFETVDNLETTDTLLSSRKHRPKSAKLSRKNVRAHETNTKKRIVKDDTTDKSVTTTLKGIQTSLDSSKAVRPNSEGSFKQVRSDSRNAVKGVRPGSEDSVSSTVRQERERLSSRKDSSFSTYIEITHNESEDLIVVENADSDDWVSSHDEFIQEDTPEVSSRPVSAIRSALEGNTPEVEDAKMDSPPRKRRPRSNRRRTGVRKQRSKSANDKDEKAKEMEMEEVITQKEEVSEQKEIASKPVYVPHSIWVHQKRSVRKNSKQTMIRVGGGFMELPYYLHYHVPINVYQVKPQSHLSNKQSFMVKSRRPDNVIVHKQYERPSWSTVKKGFKGFAWTV